MLDFDGPAQYSIRKQLEGDVMGTSRTVSGAELDSGYADNPGHKLKIEPATGQFTVRVGGALIVETNAALILYEANYPPAYYFAPEVVDMDALRRSEHTSWCPFKGRASYFSFGDDPAFENAAWSYEDPFEEIAAIKGHFSFYPNKAAVAVIDE